MKSSLKKSGISKNTLEKSGNIEKYTRKEWKYQKIHSKKVNKYRGLEYQYDKDMCFQENVQINFYQKLQLKNQFLCAMVS
jgi:hypothetical protein